MATYYYDFDLGLSTNDGLSSSTPFKNLTRTNEATGNELFFPVAGDNLLLARGSTWNSTGKWEWRDGWSGDPGNPITFDAYDRVGETGQAQPIVEAFEIFSSGDWTLSGTSGVWYATLRTDVSSCKRCFFDFVGQKNTATSIVTCTATTPWWFDNAADRIYVYTGSDTLNPNIVYTDIRCTSDAFSNQGFAVVHIQLGGSYLSFNNITFRGGNSRNVAVQNYSLGLDNGGHTWNTCNFEYSGGNGIDYDTGIDQALVGQILITKCTIDRKHSINENIGIETSTDGLRVNNGGVNYNFIIEDSIIRNFTHNQISIYNSNNVNPLNGIVVRNNLLTCPDTDYGRGISTNQAPGFLCANSLITGNLILDTNTQNQIQGESTLFIANIIDTIREFVVTGKDGTSNGITSGANAASSLDNVVIANNLIINPFDKGIETHDNVAYANGKISYYNNIVIKDDPLASQICFEHTQYNAVAPELDIQYNVFYNPNSSDIINWQQVTYTLAAAEAAKSQMSNNLNTDPLLDSDHKPDPSSPCYHAGKTISFSAKDFRGHKFNIPPTIGAYEFTSGSVAKSGRNIR